jgi:general secretion pathway protein D
MVRKIIKWIFTLLIGLSAIVIPQDRLLEEEYTPSDQLISIKSDLDYSTAIDLLSEFSIQFLGKPIHDPVKREGKVGIDIQSLAWRKALEMVLSKRGLWYIEKEHFLEIIEASEESNVQDDKSVLDIGGGSKLSIKSREVKIEAIFFEGDRKTIKEMGIDWSTFYQGDVDISAEEVGALSLSEDFLRLRVKIPEKLYGVDVDGLLKVFDSKNYGKVLAQPQIMVMEGNEGTIQVGQDFSIKQRDFAGNVIDRFYSTGTIMSVTPHILSDKENGQVIFLNIHVERSQAFPDVSTTIIKKSQANSFVQLYDGEETLIGGLYSTETITLRKGVPLLKDLPWWFLGLKYLFGFNRDEQQQKELVILIRASLLPEVLARKKSDTSSSSSRSYGLDDFDVGRWENSFDKYETKKASSTPKTAVKESMPNTPAAVKKENSQAYVKPVDITPVFPASVAQASITAPPQQKEQKVLPKEEVASSNDENADVVEYIYTGDLFKEKMERTYRGTVVKLRNNLALIEWEGRFANPEAEGKIVDVLRKDNVSGDYAVLGKLQLVKVTDKGTVAKRSTVGKYVCPELQIGDRVVAVFE